MCPSICPHFTTGQIVIPFQMCPSICSQNDHWVHCDCFCNVPINSITICLSRIQTLMTHIRRTCQEIRDIKNPLRSRKSKLINKVYLRSPGPNHDNNKGRLLGKYGEGALGG